MATHNAMLRQTGNGLWQRIWRAACVSVLVVGLLSHPAYAQDEIDGTLREEIHRVAVPGTDQRIAVTTFRPQGAGPFPWLVLSHGTGDSSVNRSIGRYRNLPLIRKWIERGFAVVVVVRRGYGASDGWRIVDDYGSCGNSDFLGAAEGAAGDILAAAAWARQFADLDQKRWLLVGQSAGGFASIHAASKQPAGLLAVLNFAGGRGGDPRTRPGEPCAAERLGEVFEAAGAKTAVPVLWHYAENDLFFGPRVSRHWFDRFVRAGGKGEYVLQSAFAPNGHGVFTHAQGGPVWMPALQPFFDKHAVPLKF